MKRVFKYPLPFKEAALVRTTRGAKLLAVAAQRGELFVWALVDPDAPPIFRVIKVRGTGSDAAEVGDYISTFQMNDGTLVFHAFDGGEVAA